MAKIALTINMYAKSHLYIDAGKFENENPADEKLFLAATETATVCIYRNSIIQYTRNI
jgi:hypothetical protein